MEDNAKIRSKDDLPDFLSRVLGFGRAKALKIEETKDEEEAVYSCPICNSLYLVESTQDKVDCFHCGNEIREKDLIRHSSIHIYKINHEVSQHKDER